MSRVVTVICDRCGRGIRYPEVVAVVARVDAASGHRIEADYCEACVVANPTARVVSTLIPEPAAEQAP